MSPNKHIILYAEDDPDDLFLVQQAFEAHDHIRVVHAGNGREALQQLNEMLERRDLPCLIILDINMPVMNGREALTAIRRNGAFAKLPVVLFTTSSNPADVAFAKSMDATFITKPVDYKNLERIALQFVDHCNFEVHKLLSELGGAAAGR